MDDLFAVAIFVLLFTCFVLLYCIDDKLKELISILRGR